jgi:hypothetical protein
VNPSAARVAVAMPTFRRLVAALATHPSIGLLETVRNRLRRRFYSIRGFDATL